MKKFAYSFVSAVLVVLAALNISCKGGGDTAAMQAQIDSLTAQVTRQAEDLGFYQGCLSLVTDGLDSIARADTHLLTISTGKEGTITRETILEDLQAYAGMLDRQRQRIAELEGQLDTDNTERARMRALIDHLNQQVEQKNAFIQQLQEKLDSKEFNIAMLQDEVNRLYAANAELTNTVNSQRKTINDTQARLNQAYYIVGTSKELKDAGVLSSKFLGKSKVDVDNIDANLFTKVNVRRFQQLSVNSKSITIKSQHPSDSYEIIVDKKNGTSTLQIRDEEAFWSLTRFLIIQE